jgi:hypothetical protein
MRQKETSAYIAVNWRNVTLVTVITNTVTYHITWLSINW